MMQIEEEKRSISEKKIANEIKQMKIMDSMTRFEQKKKQYRNSLIEKLNDINNRVILFL